MNRYLQLLSCISIHPLLWFIIVIAVLTGHFKELLMLFLIVFIHEMGHAVTAHFFRWRIKKIQLLPFGGMAEIDEHGNRPLREEFYVTIAGPLQHVWLVLVSFILYQASIISPETFHTFLIHNIVIFGFNLLPIWPLDGGKLIFIFLSGRFAFSKAHKLAMKSSIFFLIMLITASLFIFPIHLNLWVVIAFLIISQYIEWKHRHYVQMRFLIERYYGKQNTIKKLKPIIVDESDLLYHTISKFCRGCKHQIILKRTDKEQITFDENELLHAYFTEKKTTSTIGELYTIT